MKRDRFAYIIMPVGSDMAFASKRAALEFSANDSGWLFRFPMSAQLSKAGSGSSGLQFQLTEVMNEMKEASLVIADLSLERPSCYYETGIAQALNRPTLLLATIGTQIHQVNHRDDVHFYADPGEMSQIVTADLRRRK